MFLYNGQQILRPEPYRGSVVIGMNADQTGSFQKRFIQKYLYPNFTLYRDEIIISFFIIADKKVFCVRLRIGDGNLRQIGHIVYGFVFCDFMPDVFLL